MKHLQTYRIFEASQSLTPEQEQFLNKHTRGTWSVNPTTGKVDVQGNFSCVRSGETDLKKIKFGTIFGHFICSSTNLTSLTGGPEIVKGDFSCSRNSLKSLEGGPNIVGGNFECSHNDLVSLEGGPKIVGGDYYCYDSDLKSFSGAPDTLNGSFYSTYLNISEGEWSFKTLFDIWKENFPSTILKEMLDPLMDPKSLQQKINENPEGMLILLKDFLKDPHFRDLKWPSHLETERGLLSDLGDVGL